MGVGIWWVFVNAVVQLQILKKNYHSIDSIYLEHCSSVVLTQCRKILKKSEISRALTFELYHAIFL